MKYLKLYEKLEEYSLQYHLDRKYGKGYDLSKLTDDQIFSDVGLTNLKGVENLINVRYLFVNLIYEIQLQKS